MDQLKQERIIASGGESLAIGPPAFNRKKKKKKINQTLK